jgi:lysozyme
MFKEMRMENNIVNRALENVKLFEGFRKNIYKCPAGATSIGYGFNLDKGITEAEAEALAWVGLMTCYNGLMQTYAIFTELPEDIQEVLLDMGYNMGLAKLLGFKKMWLALYEQNYLQASLEILDSKYHRDFVKWANGDIESTRSFKNAEKVRRAKNAKAA